MSNHQSEAMKRCSICGAILPADAPFGQCPHCLLALPLSGKNAPSAVCQRCGQASSSTALVNGFCPNCLLAAMRDLNRTPADAPVAAIAGRVLAEEESQFGDYELLGQIGRGGMGVVYQARQRSLNRLVAVKMLLDSALSSPAMVRRFEMEAETVARLTHPNIVSIYEVGLREGQRYFSMRLVEGESLAQQIARKEFSPLPHGGREDPTRLTRTQERIGRLMVTVARAVHYAHSQGVLHRDLKPGNILIDRAGEPHLTDFGLAKTDTDGNPTGSGTLIGTPAYMAPELARGGSATVASDIYGLGAVLYELLTGRPPFRGPTPIETLRRVMDEEAAHPKTINRHSDPDLGLICLKALEKDPLLRYVNASEFADELKRWIHHEPIRARPVGTWSRMLRWTRRNRIGAALIVVLCLGLSACLVLLRAVSEQKRANQASLNTMVKVITARVSDLPNSSRPFEHFTAEEVQILLGRNPERKPVAARLVVATLIDQQPMQTVSAFGRILDRIERAFPAGRSGVTRLDLRLYKDYAALRDDLAAGAVHFASADAQLCLQAQSINPTVQVIACDRRAGLPTVIFTRADSGITNLAGLRGQSIAIRDRLLFPVSPVYALLAEAGLCARDVVCKTLAEAGMSNAKQGLFIRKSQAGAYGQQNSTVEAVLSREAFAAGVAFERQLDPNEEGTRWRRLGTFRLPDFLWIAGSRADALSRDAFAKALLQFHNPKDLESVLIDTDTSGFAYTTNTEPLLQSLRAIERARARFEQCLP